MSDFYKAYSLKRFDIAYVAESYYGDTLNFYLDEKSDEEKVVRITKMSKNEEKEVEIVRCDMKFQKK